MPTSKEISSQISDLGFKESLLPKAEMQTLPEMLVADERICGVASGLYKERNGILIATNNRVLFYYKGRLMGSHVEEFRYEQITTVEYKTGLLCGEIIVYSAGNASKIEMVPNMYCKPFADAVRSILGAKNKPVQPATSEGFLPQLERLASLKREGLLTDEEFKAAKEKLLSG